MPETASAMQSKVKNLETDMAEGQVISIVIRRMVSVTFRARSFSIQANHQMKPTILGTFEGKKHVSENWDISRLMDDCDNKEKICEMLGEMLELAALVHLNIGCRCKRERMACVWHMSGSDPTFTFFVIVIP